ncbi:hypothetical protein CSC37_1961 [Escherichia coli]|nr:hypothetical protein CSC37_1961 [Escherichia coli]
MHSHAIFYINGQNHKKSFPFVLEAKSMWLKISKEEGRRKNKMVSGG